SIYHASLNRAMAAADKDDWRLKTVEALVRPASAVVDRRTTLRQMLEQLPKRPIERVFVREDDELVAWLDPRQVYERVQSQELAADLTVESVSHPVTFTLSPDMSLCVALDGFLREEAMVLPVTPGEWRANLIGEVSRRDVLLAIQDRLTYPK